MAENKIKFGFKNLYYAVRHEENGVVTYDVPKKWQGAVSFTGDVESEETKVYADDTVYWSAYKNNGRTGDLQVMSVPDYVLKDIFNYVEATDGGLLEDAYALTNSVALLFEVSGDDHNTRKIYYNVTLGAPTSEENTTEESIDPQAQSISYTAIPQVDATGDHAFVSRSVPAGSAAYENFFKNAPTIPTVKVGD